MNSWSMQYSFEVDTERRIICEKIYGIWKPETGEQYHKDFMEAVRPLIDEPWAKLVDLQNWKTSYPQVVDRIGTHLKWCKSHNMVLSVNVLDNPSTYRQLNEMFTAAGTGAISRTFRTREEADKFLEENWYNQPDNK
jgi:hypothetical protein